VIDADGVLVNEWIFSSPDVSQFVWIGFFKGLSLGFECHVFVKIQNILFRKSFCASEEGAYKFNTHIMNIYIPIGEIRILIPYSRSFNLC